MPTRWPQVVYFVSATLENGLDMVGGVCWFATAVAGRIVF
jgi:hypothetical protein